MQTIQVNMKTSKNNADSIMINNIVLGLLNKTLMNYLSQNWRHIH